MLCAFAALPQAHAEIVSAPAAISDVYSDINMRVQLATTKDVSTPCAAEECAQNKEFNQQVQDIGTRLSEVAFEAYPDLSKRISHFGFVVAEKNGPGTTSNAAGTVVIFRGVQQLYLEEQALAFVIAREMGRVIGRHHDKNTGTSILLSVLVGVLFPASGILQGINGSAAVANATSTATTAVTTAASSATSFVGSKMVLAGIKPKQLREADVIAMRLLEPMDWSGSDIASSLEACTHIDGEDAWAKDFRFSTAHVRTLVPEEAITIASAEPKAEPPHSQVAQHVKPGEAAVNMPEQNTHLEDTVKVAKNEVGVSSDALVVGDLVAPQTSASEAELPGVQLEEQEVAIGDEASDALMEESQLSDDVSHPVTRNLIKPSTHGTTAKKAVTRASLSKKGNKAASRKAIKVASKNTKQKLAKADVGSKQGSSKKLYASKSAKVKLGMAGISKTKARAGLNSVKSASTSAKKVKAKQIKPSLR